MTHASRATVEADVLEREVIDDQLVDRDLLRRLLQRAGRGIAAPALEALELMLAESTPGPARITMLAALTYLLVPTDLIPDLVPVEGFSDDMVALTAMISVWSNHVTPDIRSRVQRTLDRWFPLTP